LASKKGQINLVSKDQLEKIPPTLRDQVTVTPPVDQEFVQDLCNAAIFSSQDACNCLASRIMREKIAPKLFKNMREKYV